MVIIRQRIYMAYAYRMMVRGKRLAHLNKRMINNMINVLGAASRFCVMVGKMILPVGLSSVPCFRWVLSSSQSFFIPMSSSVFGPLPSVYTSLLFLRYPLSPFCVSLLSLCLIREAITPDICFIKAMRNTSKKTTSL